MRPLPRLPDTRVEAVEPRPARDRPRGGGTRSATSCTRCATTATRTRRSPRACGARHRGVFGYSHAMGGWPGGWVGADLGQVKPGGVVAVRGAGGVFAGFVDKSPLGAMMNKGLTVRGEVDGNLRSGFLPHG